MPNDIMIDSQVIKLNAWLLDNVLLDLPNVVGNSHENIMLLSQKCYDWLICHGANPVLTSLQHFRVIYVKNQVKLYNMYATDFK